jgi:putative addiction module component (TIGR02574 family)
MSTISVSDLLHLSVAERIQLVEDLWDSIAAEPEALELTEAQKEELDRRMAEHKADPSSAIPWEEVRARLRQRFP